MQYTYYPGCSLHATGVGYDKSMRIVFDRLGVDLNELDDWNCCGATAYMSVKQTVANAVSARNLALAAQAGDDLVAPCAACYYALRSTQERLDEIPELRADVTAALNEAGLDYDTVPVRHPLEVLLNDIGIDRIVAAQTHSVADFRPACYYGCQIVRPYPAIGGDPEIPMALEELMIALGATPVDYPPKVRCCGGMLIATFEDAAYELGDELLGWAYERKANCIVTVCPLCQSNLDLAALHAKKASNGKRPMPTLFFTQLIGLALGATPHELGVHQTLVPVEMEAKPLAVAGKREA
jgi:heterodisulfide reductase subunit B